MPTSRRRRARRSWWLAALLVLLLAGLIRLAWDLFTHWPELGVGGGLRFAVLLALRGAALTVGAWALPAVWRTVRDGIGPPPVGDAARAVAVILLVAIAAGTLVDLVTPIEDDRFAVRSAYSSALLLAAGFWLRRWCRPPSAPETVSAAGSRLGVLAVNLLAALIALEAVALGFTWLRPTRLLWDEESAQASVDANRLRPGSMYRGFPANSGGYYDREFHRAGRGDLVVALLADSFGVGIVPYKHNFATVMERRLARRAPVAGRVAVNNFGVASIGLPEYAWLLANEVPATAPTRIVLGLFVGNDLSDLASRRRHGFYSVRQLQLFELGRRLAALGRASRRAAAGHEIGRRRRPGPARPEGTFDPETFLEIELASFELCNTKNAEMDRLYRLAFEWLDRLHAAAGAKLLVVLIPDEYQVNDELFAILRSRVMAPEAYDRFYPQRRLEPFCRRRGIEVLDLLPPLRRANRQRPVYRLRDTHWNERGNRIAGEAIADQLVAGTAP